MESHEIPWFQTTQQHRKNAVIFQMGRTNQQYLGNFQSQYWDPLESNDSNRDRQTIVFLVWEGGPRWGEITCKQTITKWPVAGFLAHLKNMNIYESQMGSGIIQEKRHK